MTACHFFHSQHDSKEITLFRVIVSLELEKTLKTFYPNSELEKLRFIQDHPGSKLNRQDLNVGSLTPELVLIHCTMLSQRIWI